MIDMEITNRFKIGDKVKLISTLTEQNTGIGQNVLDELLQQEYLTITNSSPEDTYELNDYWWFSADQLKTIYINNSHETLNQLIDMRIEDYLNKPLKLQVKYIDKNITPIEKKDGGDLIDLRVSTVKRNGVKESFPCKYKKGDSLFFGLGFALKVPYNKKSNVYPRSGMFKNYGFLLTNSVGQIDNSYSGNDDEWKAMMYCTRDGEINYNDRILQFEVVDRTMENIEFEVVDNLDEANRGGYSSTGVK